VATEVISTIRSSGGDYTTLSAWEAGEQGNLVTADEIRTAECYDDWPSGLADNVSIVGSTVDSTRYMRITVAAGHRHNGTPQTGFFLKKSTGFSGLIYNDQSYTRMSWLDAENTHTTTNLVYRIGNVTAPKMENCLGKSAGSGGVVFADIANTAKLICCLAYGSATGFAVTSGVTTTTLLNCVAAGCTTGFLRSIGTTKNCVAYNNTTNWGAGTPEAASTNNATSSGSDDAPGGSSVISVASGDFVNAAANDFHLSSGSVLIGAGANLTSDFTIDIDGDTWPSSGAWDIGFDRYVSAGGGAVVPGANYRRYGQAVNRASTY
jgi:hypothetical protein